MQANRRHLVTQAKKAKNRSDEKTAKKKEDEENVKFCEVGEMKMRGNDKQCKLQGDEISD